MSWSSADIPDQTGKVAVITGANGGLGLASAKVLADKGAHVVMAARDQAKAAAAKDEILTATPDASLEVVELDLGSLASVADAAEVIDRAHPRIDILMLNAGVMAMPQTDTVDGFDVQMGINVLGHWALLSRLLPAVANTPDSRTVTLASVAQHTGRAVRPADPHQRTGWDAWGMYGQTKLAARHLGVGLQRQFDRHGLTAKAVVAHPGLTHSDLQVTSHASGGAGFLGGFFEKYAATFGMQTDRGALSQLRAATDPGVPGGAMVGPLFATNGPPVRKPLVRPGTDGAVASLWQACEAETGLRVDVSSVLAG